MNKEILNEFMKTPIFNNAYIEWLEDRVEFERRKKNT
jgi:hypothetical protein